MQIKGTKQMYLEISFIPFTLYLLRHIDSQFLNTFNSNAKYDLTRSWDFIISYISNASKIPIFLIHNIHIYNTLIKKIHIFIKRNPSYLL